MRRRIEIQEDGPHAQRNLFYATYMDIQPIMDSDDARAFLQGLFEIFARIVRFGGTLSVALIILALGWISNEITTRVFGSTIFEFFGSWMWVFAAVLLVLSLLIIYAIKRIGGLEP